MCKGLCQIEIPFNVLGGIGEEEQSTGLREPCGLREQSPVWWLFLEEGQMVQCQTAKNSHMYYQSHSFLRNLSFLRFLHFSWYLAHILFLDFTKNNFFLNPLTFPISVLSSEKHLSDFSVWSLIFHFYEIMIFLMLLEVFHSLLIHINIALTCVHIKSFINLPVGITAHTGLSRQVKDSFNSGFT